MRGAPAIKTLAPPIHAGHTTAPRCHADGGHATAVQHRQSAASVGSLWLRRPFSRFVAAPARKNNDRFWSTASGPDWAYSRATEEIPEHPQSQLPFFVVF